MVRLHAIAAALLGLFIAARAEAVSGIVYDSATFQPISGALVFLVDEATGERVPRELLGPDQQGQRTGSAGTYQFDPPVGNYRIEVSVAAGYEFPARPLPLGGSADMPFGALGNNTASNQVSPHNEPLSAAAAGETLPYYLRFHSNGARGELTNNHVPLTPSHTLVTMTHIARLPRIETGESAAFIVRIGNGSTRPLPEAATAPLVIGVGLAQGFELGEVIVNDTTTGVRATGFSVTKSRAGFEVTNLTIPPGAMYDIRYMVSAGATVRPKRHAFLATLRNSFGGVAPDAYAYLQVEADPLFERSEIIGRVFCSDKGGIPRARVYLDNGSYAVTDDNGKFHFSNVSGGYHLAKIDEDTVPPGSTPLRSIRRDFHLTPGLPAKIDFPFRCALAETTVTRTEPASMPQVEISGTEEPLAISVNGETFLGNEADITRTLDGFQTRVKAVSPISQWAVLVRDGANRVVYRIDGRGAVPETIPAQLPLAPGTYTYELALFSDDLYARSPKQTLSIGSAVAKSTVLRGNFFTPTQRATPELLAKVGELKAELLSNDAPIIVEAHIANDGAAADRQAVTDKQAAAVKTTLVGYGVAESRITARGKADQEPLTPNTGPKAQEKNRRIVITTQAAAPASAPSSASAPVHRALVHGVDVAIENGAFKTNVWPAERTTVMLERADGRAFGIRTGYAAPKSSASVDLVGGLSSDTLQVSGRVVPLALASFGCTLQTSSPLLREDRSLVAPLRFVFTGKLAELRDVRVALFDAADQQIAVVPAADGVATYGERGLSPGPYTYRCSAKDTFEGTVTTAPELFSLDTGGSEEVIVRGRLFENGAVGPDLKVALDALVARGATGGAVAVEVHSGAQPTANAQREQIATLVEAGIVKKYLEDKGVKDVQAKGLGKSQPLVPPLGKKQIEQNRRVVLRSEVTASSQPSSLPVLSLAPPAPKSLEINGQKVDFDDRGQFATTVNMTDALVMKVQNGQGRETIFHVPREQAASDQVEKGRTPFAGEPPPEVLFEGKEEQLDEAILASSEPASNETNEVRLALPDEGAVIKQDSLAVQAFGPPGSEIIANGVHKKALDEEGKATVDVPLIAGENNLIFDVKTPDGRSGQLVRKVVMQPNRWFLLALGEASFGQGGAQALLPETENGDSTVKIMNGEYFLHGRAAIYFKGRVKGDWFFKDNRFTAYVDSAYAEQGQFVRNVIEPDKFYPVYGDQAAEVQDVRQGKLYVLVEADASKLEGGNILTQIKGVELFRYDRALFGARLDWNKGFSKYDHTRLQAFVGQPLQSSRRVHATLRGTGGSLYFLRDRDILEGSEQIRIVVRDAVSGTVVEEVEKKRNVDYTISYDTGRVVFLEPVSAYAQGSLAARLTPISVAQGNAVYIEADYEARDYGLGNQFAVGGYVKETLFDKVTVGGGIVNESRSGRVDYRLYGGSVEVKPIDGVTFSGELNRSEGRDTDLAITTDGGQTFADIQKTEVDNERPVTGFAMKATAKLDLQKILKFKRELVTLSAYGARIDPNYYASNATLEQGQVKFGVAARGAITAKDFVIARHDGIWSDLPVLNLPGFAEYSSRRLNRQLTSAAYEHVESRWDAGLLYYHTFADDSATAQDIHTDTLNVRGAFKVTPKLTLFATQEFILQADPTIITNTADRFATEVGVRFKLHDRLEAFVSEIVRYSGTNATQVGLRAKVGDEGRFYVAERFSRDLSGFTTTTIVGGEDAVARGSRAYGEYQLDAGGYGPQARAVYGLNNRWELTNGLYVGLLYERSQNVGTATGIGTGTASIQGGLPTTSPSYVGQGSGLLARDRAFFNPSAILGLSFPVGIASRDAASVSLEFLRLKFLKLTGRFELRFDNQDIRLGGADRLTLFATAGLAIQLHRDLSFLGRLEWADAREAAQGRAIAKMTQMSLGLAYRPVHHDFVNALFKFTRREFFKGDTSEHEIVDALSLVPMFEIPYIRTQIVEKLAVKMQQLQLDDMAIQRVTTWLLINRLNFHVLKWLDLGVEYRFKKGAGDGQGGFLGEVSVSPWEYVRLGVGYNFTHFSDDELADDRIDNRGFFVRAVGKY